MLKKPDKILRRVGSDARPLPESPMQDFFALRLGRIWTYFVGEHFSFWAICGYLVIEYVRPQSIVPALAVLPWGALFLLLALVGLLVDKQRRLVRNPATVWMMLFLAVILLSSAMAEFPGQSWPHVMDYVTWFITYWLIINIVRTQKRFFIFLAIFLLATFKISLFTANVWAMRGFAFTTWGLQGPPGFMENSGELSIQMLMFAPVAYQAAISLRPSLSSIKFYVLLLFPISAAMTIIGASSRGAQIAIIYQVYRTLIKGKLSLKTLLVTGILVAAGYAIFPEEQKARFTAAGDDRTSRQRLLYWKHGAEMIREHPVFGVGFFNFAAYYDANYPEDVLFNSAQLPHNIFVQVGTDTGLTGLFIYLMILYSNAKSAREIQNVCIRAGPEPIFAASIAKGLLTSLWGFIIAGQFVSVAYYPFIWMNLAMTVALLNVVRVEVDLPPKGRSAKGGAARSRTPRRQPAS